MYIILGRCGLCPRQSGINNYHLFADDKQLFRFVAVGLRREHGQECAEKVDLCRRCLEAWRESRRLQLMLNAAKTEVV